MNENELKYGNRLIYMEGIIVAVQDGAVEIDLKGRLGKLKIPRRMLITDYQVKQGQIVGFNMSYPEITSEQINQNYINKTNQSHHNKEAVYE